MESAESFLRVAGVVITLLMAVLLVRDTGRTLVGKLAGTFSLGVATYMVCSSPGFHELPPYVHVPVLALCVSNPIFFWLLARVLVYGLLAARLAPRRLQTARADLRQIAREVGWSLVSAVIFGTTSMVLVIGPGELDWNRMYFDIGAWGWSYALCTLALMIVAHDAYFDWTHRLMHHPVVLHWVHRTHHLSRTPTPWTAYAFHPSEAVVQVAFPPLLAALVPLHPLILLLWSVHMVVRNVLGHAGFELMPAGFARSRWLGWLTTATHHDLHHETFRWNYGLYFTWWDRLMGTEHPEYLARFDMATGVLRKPQGVEAAS